MNKNISSEFAVGILLLVAIFTGGIFIMLGKKQVLEMEYAFKDQKFSVAAPKAKTNKEKKADTEQICQPRYFEGEADVRVWLSGTNDDDSKVNVRIKNEDIEKLPTTKVDSLNANFYATLIDPTEEVKAKLANASEENPALITVRGFAQACKEAPEFSIKEGTVAFKKG